jgi:putative NADH-flavin reductase
MVKIGLFGGTGGCGSAFLKYALEANHMITLQARTPSKVTVSHENLSVVHVTGLPPKMY